MNKYQKQTADIMKKKLIAVHEDNIALPQPTLIALTPDKNSYDLSEDKQTLTITLRNHYGVIDGKHLLRKMLTEPEWGAVSTLNIVVEDNTNPQFVGFYTVFPPGIKNPIKTFGRPEKLNINYYFTGDTAPQLLHLITCQTETGIGTFSEANKGVGTFASARVFVPEGQKEVLKERMTKTHENLLKAGLHTEDYYARMMEYLETIQECASADLPQRTPSAEQRPAYPLAPLLSSENIESIRKGDIFHIPSDETTHLQLIGKTLVITDTGSQELPQYLKQLEPFFDRVIIYQTHFHDDHCGYLKQSLGATQKPIGVYIPDGAKGQFLGYTATHVDAFFDEEGKLNPNLRLHTLAESQPEETEDPNIVISTLEAQGNIKHYIHSSGLIVTDRTNKKATFCTGDINPDMPAYFQSADKERFLQETQDNVIAYFQKAVDQALANGCQKIDIFYDQGHFEVIPFSTKINKPLLKKIIQEANKDKSIHIQLHEEHHKCPEGHLVAERRRSSTVGPLSGGLSPMRDPRTLSQSQHHLDSINT